MLSIHVQGQTFSEWFFQNKTQIKYLHKQIAALVVFVHDLDHGYSVVQAGTGLIGGLQQEDQDQHRSYFSSLMEAKPSVINDPSVASIQTWAVEIQKAAKAFWDVSQQSQWMSPAEKFLAGRTATALRKASSDDLTLLERLLEKGSWEMTDADRLSHINDISQAMQRRLKAAMEFRNLVDQLIRCRERDRENAEELFSLYGKK
jgi:hypothetical protein